MKGIIVRQEKGQPILAWEDVVEINFGPEEVLVDVRATAVNRADLSQARGDYPPPPGVTEILGLEMAGTIREVGENVPGWVPGDKVCALLSGGGYAERVAVHHRMLLPLMDNQDFEEGAAVPEVWFTAYVNLFREGHLKENERVLIHAGGSGVGTAAIQLARDAGATIFVTAGSEDKLKVCRDLGANFTANYKKEDFLSVVLEGTESKGVDLILDPVGGPYLEKNIQALGPMGRLVSIGLLGGPQGALNLSAVLRKRLKIVGSTLRSRPLEEKINITEQFREHYWPKLQAGELKSIIDRVFPLPEAQKAHEYVRQNRNIGKVILTIG